MKLKFLALLFFSIYFVSVKAQESEIRKLNAYENVIVPVQFDSAKQENEYLLSSLTRHLLKQHGFNVFMDNETLPIAAQQDPCLNLRASVLTQGGMFAFTTEVTLVFYDCRNQIVYKAQGSSREKKFDKAHQEALRDAFDKFGGYRYAYEPLKKGEQHETQLQQKQSIQKQLAPQYNWEGKRYQLQKIELGYLLLDAEGNRKAVITENSDKQYFFNSADINGSLKIDTNQDLIVEYFNMQTGKQEKIILNVINQ